jgi:hypothetical protein
MKPLYTSDREQWWQDTCRTWDTARPADLRPVWERKPMVNGEIFHLFSGVVSRSAGSGR